MNTEFIQLKGVTKKFRRNIVLDNIDLSIPEHQITGIIGASGEGKTTILKLIIAFYKPNKGDVLYLKRSVLSDLKYIRRLFGFSTEDGSFYENLSVKENIFHFGNLYKMKRSDLKERYKNLVDLVGLDHAQRTLAKNLSVGMKKRLDIACSLIHNPEVLILDEPTADLDPLLRDQILNLIIKIRDSGTTIILTSQLLEEMDKVCDKVAILCNRKIVEEGTPASIRSKYKTDSLNGVFAKLFKGRFKEATPEKSKSEKGKSDDKGNNGKDKKEAVKEVPREIPVEKKSRLNISGFFKKFESSFSPKKADVGKAPEKGPDNFSSFFKENKDPDQGKATLNPRDPEGKNG